MPLELVAVAPRSPELREYEDRPPGPGEVLVRSTLSAEKHGTMLALYRGDVPISWDAPLHLGNQSVGLVEAVGPGVEGLAVGDRVYGYLPIRETHTVSAQHLRRAPEGVSDDKLVCVDPALVALLAVREGMVRLGDAVAVYGTGAIGLMAVRLAKLAGATLVIAVEPLAPRAELAPRYGADLVVDPTACPDTGMRVRELTEGQGADIAIETSGSFIALHQAIRGTAFGGAIVPVAWYHGDGLGLRLGEEFHVNRQTLVSGARWESAPYRDHPRWDPDRVERTVVQLYERGQLTNEGMLNPVVHITKAVEAYRGIDEHPESSLKLGVRYG